MVQAGDRRVAIVTGASRGTGRGCAIELARAGFDVVICARTVAEGESREHSSTVAKSDTTPLPGSLEKTGREIEAVGARALALKFDLNEPAGAADVLARAMEVFGRVDVLVNNARYIGPGHMDLFLDTPIELYEAHDRCNVIGTLAMTKAVVPQMIAQGGGIIINMASRAGWQEIAALPGKGGWGLGYSVSKAGVNRIAFGLAKELKQYNIAVLNVEPGSVGTERIIQDMGPFGYTAANALTTDVPGKVVAKIATHQTPMYFSGRSVDGPTFAVEHELIRPEEIPDRYGLPSWGVPSPFVWKGEGSFS